MSNSDALDRVLSMYDSNRYEGSKEAVLQQIQSLNSAERYRCLLNATNSHTLLGCFFDVPRPNEFVKLLPSAYKTAAPKTASSRSEVEQMRCEAESECTTLFLSQHTLSPAVAAISNSSENLISTSSLAKFGGTGADGAVLEVDSGQKYAKSLQRL